MKALDEKTWKSFYVSSIFDVIQRGKRLKNADHVSGMTPYVSSTADNNGVDDYIEATIGTRVFGDCISLANSGSVGTTFYEPFNFVASDHVTHLKKNAASEFAYLFLVTVLENQKTNFNFNREINDVRIQNLKIMLPVNDAGKPDYDYMGKYAVAKKVSLLSRYRTFIDKRLAALEYKDIPALSEKTWQTFSAFGNKDALFSIATTNSSIDAIRLIKKGSKTLPYVTRTDMKNGISRFVSDENRRFGYDEAGCISIGLDTQTAFWQPHDFVTGQNIQVITSPHLNAYVAQFVLPLFKKQMYAKFNWGGNGATLKRMKTLEIMLPVNDTGDPDFTYMEQYAKNMMRRKYEQYLSFLERQAAKTSH